MNSYHVTVGLKRGLTDQEVAALRAAEWTVDGDTAALKIRAETAGSAARVVRGALPMAQRALLGRVTRVDLV